MNRQNESNNPFFISNNSLIINNIGNIPHIFNTQTNFIYNINQNEEEGENQNEKEGENQNEKEEENQNEKEGENQNEEEGENKLNNISNNISNDINKIIKHTLNNDSNYNFNITDDSISVNFQNSDGDLNVIKNIMTYLYYKQINGELNNFRNIGEFVVQSYSSIPIQTNYLFENDEEFDYFANCKLINKLVGKAEKIKKDDPLLVDEESCFICFEKYKEKELKRKLPHCNHFFHKKCIDKWLKNKSTCPHCRIDLMDHITLSEVDRKEYYKKCCNCEDVEEDDEEEAEYIQYNLGIIGFHSVNKEEEANKEENN